MSQTKRHDPFENIEKVIIFIFNSIKELFIAAGNNSLPWMYLSMNFLMINLIFFNDLDQVLFNELDLLKHYNSKPYYEWALYGSLVFIVLLAVGARLYNKKKTFLKNLTDAFLISGLKNKAGNYPNFVSDSPLDDHNRKLVLTSSQLPLSAFQEKEENIAASLFIFIDEIKEIRGKGLIEILYSHIPMPDVVPHDLISPSKKYKISVGRTRTSEIFQDFNKSPHLLIAGQTGGGKSTFLRHLITSLYLNHKKANFKLIDLKEGLEFQTFKNLKRVEVVDTIDKVIGSISNYDQILNERMKFLKEHKVKDIEAYFRKVKTGGADKKAQEISFDREFIIVDEIAELFLSSSHADVEQVMLVRKVLSRVARLGRACGLHLIAATQRPDAKALDSQIKLNLTSTICFQMANAVSSRVVLDSGRASDLPEVPGRAIWKSGNKLTEIQTPYLTEEKAVELLEPHRVSYEESLSDNTSSSSSSKSVDQKDKRDSSDDKVVTLEISSNLHDE